VKRNSDPLVRRMVDKKVDLEPVVKRVNSRKFNC
jgi:hypothetical protein